MAFDSFGEAQVNNTENSIGIKSIENNHLA